jgi:ribosomal protein L37AE/L43A
MFDSAEQGYVQFVVPDLSMPSTGARVARSPRYFEAHPTLDIVGAQRAWRQKRPCGEWYNERSQLVARAELLAFGLEAIELAYEWVDHGKRFHGQAVLPLVHRRSPTARQLPDAICPDCRRAHRALHLAGGVWACSACLGLVARATLLTERERVLLQAQQLQMEVHGRPPPTRGFRTRDMKRHKLIGLVEKLGGLTGEELRPEVRASVKVTWSAAFTDDSEVTWCERTDCAARMELPIAPPWFGQY